MDSKNSGRKISKAKKGPAALWSFGKAKEAAKSRFALFPGGSGGFSKKIFSRGKAPLLLFLKGGALGLSAILPGVSGGTMAFILGLYRELIDEIAKIRAGHITLLPIFFRRGADSSPFPKLYNWSFLLPLAAGAALSLAAFAAAAPALIEANPLEFRSLIFGFVLASLFAPLKEMEKSFKTVSLLLASAAAHFSLFYFVGGIAEEGAAAAPPAAFLLWSAPAGLLAALALIIPGVSGAYLLILLGLYHPLLEAIRGFDLAALSLFAFGGIFGIVFAARGISRLLRLFFHEAMALICGLILGSLCAVWPFPGKSPLALLSFGPEQQSFFIWFGGAFALVLALTAARGLKKKP